MRFLVKYGVASLVGFTLLACVVSRNVDATDIPADVRPLPSNAEILVIGDSVMWWHSDDHASVSHILAARLDTVVANLSIPGAPFAAEDHDSIQVQYRPGPWDWVVMNGGANDLGDCGCGACLDVVDALISEDATSGQIPGFVDAMRENGSNVLLTGYYHVMTQTGRLEACMEEFHALNTRLDLLAERKTGVEFAPLEDLILRRADFDDDLVHASRLGTRKIGDRIADVIEASG
ncbi:MAG: SGNH/GDSL hydrolase family protein [Pseudomonadota bacterium]